MQSQRNPTPGTHRPHAARFNPKVDAPPAGAKLCNNPACAKVKSLDAFRYREDRGRYVARCRVCERRQNNEIARRPESRRRVAALKSSPEYLARERRRYAEGVRDRRDYFREWGRRPITKVKKSRWHFLRQLAKGPPPDREAKLRGLVAACDREIARMAAARK